MPNFTSAESGSASGAKKIITIVIIVLVVLGLAYYLFKISPQTVSNTASAYNSLVTQTQQKAITQPPAFDPNVDDYLGNPKAKNVFVEYGDMQCPACAAYEDIVKQIPNNFTDTVLVFRYFPLVQIHQNAVESALANEAAGAQGKYWEMHDLLFSKQNEWETATDPLSLFTQYAQTAGVANIDQFKSDVTSHKYLDKIQADNNQSLALSLQGTPTFFFNGHLLQNQDLAGLKKEAEPFLNK
jgi:protein-disulfide isomerase